MESIETIKEKIENFNDDAKIRLWNDYQIETSGDDEIRENVSSELEIFFTSFDDVLRAAYYGNYCYTDAYFTINAYGNLITFQYLSDEKCPFDLEELANWVADEGREDMLSDYE